MPGRSTHHPQTGMRATERTRTTSASTDSSKSAPAEVVLVRRATYLLQASRTSASAPTVTAGHEKPTLPRTRAAKTMMSPRRRVVMSSAGCPHFSARNRLRPAPRTARAAMMRIVDHWGWTARARTIAAPSTLSGAKRRSPGVGGGWWGSAHASVRIRQRPACRTVIVRCGIVRGGLPGEDSAADGGALCFVVNDRPGPCPAAP